ncbi:MAG TPA: DNA translocase FtsK [Anaerolineae bacterium]|nr:DNA translocase FtsK [Anaerolineae bacterium]
MSRKRRQRSPDLWDRISEALLAAQAETVGLVVLTVGGLALFSLIPSGDPQAGPSLLRVLLGWGAYPVALAFLAGGILLLLSQQLRLERYWRWELLIGLELLLLGLLPVIHLLAAREDALAWARAGYGGGLVGWALAQCPNELLGPAPSMVIFVLISGVGIWLMWSQMSVRVHIPWSEWRDLLERWLLLPTRSPESTDALPAEPETDSVDVAIERALARHAQTHDVPSPVQTSPRGKRRTLSPRKRRREATKPPATPVLRADDERLPPLELLRPDASEQFGDADAQAKANTIIQTLAAFGVPAELVSIHQGPTVTQFGVRPGFVERGGEQRKVPVSKIARLSNDLALALAASRVRIEAPVPGRPYVGIEVPNDTPSLVSLRGVLESSAFKKLKSPLAVALGRDVSGKPVAANLGQMPHLLITGATGSGKSVCIHCIITALLLHNPPERLQLILIDPKMVELPIYNGIPHLVGPVIVDVNQVVPALTWTLLQMDERYRRFAEEGVRHIEAYNKRVARRKEGQPMPYIIIVIDELADLVLAAPDDVERHITRLAQMARATGIHLVIATQRPSVDVLTGLIKANFPARIAFAVTSQVDSRVILDVPGAEKLLGKGDMLFMRPDSSKLARIQGCYISDREIQAIVHHWRYYAVTSKEGPPLPPWTGLPLDKEDELLNQAIKLLQGQRTASASWLQRKLRIGFNRAARLIEQLEEEGIVGPDPGGGRPREVLIHREDQSR